jgi:hypothetical protein
VAEQVTGAVEETGAEGSLAYGTEHAVEHNPGKPMSWVAVAVIVVGFLVGGVALVPHPRWWMFWLGAGIAVVGCLMTVFSHTFADDWY